MKFHEMLPFRIALIGSAMIALSQRATALDGLSNTYCSTENTGSGSGPTYNRYQSMGACSTLCQDQYAFAILQGSDCWCSNYIPAQQSSVSDCDTTCPGYPSDLCGNPSQGLFGYIALNKAPLGTAGGSQPQSTAPPASTSSPADTTTRPSNNPPSTSSTQFSPSSAVVHTKVVTLSGSVVTQTVTTTPVVIGGDAPVTAQMDRHDLSAGAIAGIVLGSLLGLAALLIGAFLLWRRKQDSDAEGQGTTRPRRTTSVLSRTGLLVRGRPQSMAENPFDNSHAANLSHDPYFGSGAVGGTTSTRNSMLFGAGGVGMMGAGITIEPSSPLGASRDDLASGSGSGSGNASRRHSRPLVYDQRLNPSALFANPELNGSRVSMQDQQDYSRPLGVVNPDMRHSFDSR